jgi:hypothetical protein
MLAGPHAFEARILGRARDRGRRGGNRAWTGIDPKKSEFHSRDYYTNRRKATSLADAIRRAFHA